MQRKPGCKLFYTFAQLQELDARLVASLVTGTPEDLDGDRAA